LSFRRPHWITTSTCEWNAKRLSRRLYCEYDALDENTKRKRESSFSQRRPRRSLGSEETTRREKI
jgi:hypothetical protein